METGLFEAIKAYTSQDYYPFHMPGHKRNIALIDRLYSIDITEIDGFDDLHRAEGIIQEGMERLAAAVGADRSWFLVGGSTCGILAAVHAAAKPGGRILVARNCHVSVANAIQLRRLDPCYIYPQLVDNWWITGEISVDKVEKACEQLGDKPVFILTSPTYEGFCSNIREIAEVIHKRDGVLIVDEAHGAHLPYAGRDDAPESAVACGADIVIQSLHKTLPALTQSAALHLNGSRVDGQRIEEALKIYETSSPSYVMMAGIDACVRYMQGEGRRRLDWLYGRLRQFYRKAETWENLEVLPVSPGRDSSRIAIRMKGSAHGGKELFRQLKDRFHIEAEYCTPGFVLLLASLGDNEEGFFRLEQALAEIDGELREKGQDKGAAVCCVDKAGRSDSRCQSGSEAGADSRCQPGNEAGADSCCQPGSEVSADSLCQSGSEAGAFSLHLLPESEALLPPWQACEREWSSLDIRAAQGRICAEQAFVYPPGIPFLLPGEVITAEHIRLLLYYQEKGSAIAGLRDKSGQTICCITDLPRTRGITGL